MIKKVVEISSGGVIFKKSNNSFEIALISKRKGKIWCLPKGHVEEGEHLTETAVREVKEETGLTGRITDKLGDITYWYYIKEENIKCRKTVYFYLMEYVSGDTADHDMEVDEAEWFSLETALEKVSFKGDRNMIAKAIEKLQSLHLSA